MLLTFPDVDGCGSGFIRASFAPNVNRALLRFDAAEICPTLALVMPKVDRCQADRERERNRANDRAVCQDCTDHRHTPSCERIARSVIHRATESASFTSSICNHLGAYSGSGQYLFLLVFEMTWHVDCSYARMRGHSRSRGRVFDCSISRAHCPNALRRTCDSAIFFLFCDLGRGVFSVRPRAS